MQESLLDRQKHILSHLIDLYVEPAQPVGSRTLARVGHFNLSPATIRNEMSGLEERGYITHPHTSSGRVPTDKGYRFYVDAVPEPAGLDSELLRKIKRHFQAKIRDLEDLARLSSKVLAGLTEQAAIVLYPQPDRLCLNRVDLFFVDRRQVLVVWSSTSGFEANRLVDVGGEVLSPDLLKRITYLLNDELQGVRFSEAEPHMLEVLLKRRDALAKVQALVDVILKQSIGQASLPNYTLNGGEHLLDKPEFQDVRILRRVMHLLTTEDRPENPWWLLVQKDLEACRLRVHIGAENPEALQDMALVVHPYEFGGASAGAFVLVGPRRMAYREVITAVRHVSHVFSENVERLNRSFG